LVLLSPLRKSCDPLFRKGHGSGWQWSYWSSEDIQHGSSGMELVSTSLVSASVKNKCLNSSQLPWMHQGML
jgi:hypothetical protein